MRIYESLQRRHTGRYGVAKHQPVYSTVYSDADQRKRVTGLCAENSPVLSLGHHIITGDLRLLTEVFHIIIYGL